MKNQLFAIGAALMLGLATVGCASTPQSGSRSADTMVEVENNNSLLVSVEAVNDGVDYNLGQVETGTSETFELPEVINDAYDLQIRIDPIGSGQTYVTDDILYSPGDLIRVEVEGNLTFTTVSVY